MVFFDDNNDSSSNNSSKDLFVDSSIENNTNNNLVSIEKEMSSSYLNYAMSVIVSRALPDLRDGLKPVHRRILYAMYESKCFPGSAFRKSARVVGDVMGKYHPHGDSAIYDALVRMAQDFSMRVPLVDGQGNFGSMDGDAAAAMRYTESKLEKVTMSLLSDLDYNAVDYIANYDGSEKEPIVLPAKYPNLLVNGSNGIAVGMATNIPPHNLGEIIDATLAYIDNENITCEELLEFVKGPDFPTGGIILGRSGIISGLKTGRGSIIIRSKCEILDTGTKQTIIVHEVPYQVNKARLIEKIAELVKDKKVEGIKELRDESNKKGVRIVIELKQGVNADLILNQLYSYSQLQVSYGINILAINNKKPQQLGLLAILNSFLRFRENIVTRKINYLLNKARDKAHLLIGLTIALDSIDEIVAIIRNAKNPTEAKELLLNKTWKAANVILLIELVDDRNNKIEGDRCYFTATQVQAILDMRLAKLTGLERLKIESDLKILGTEIHRYLEILGNREEVLNIIREDLVEIKEKFATPRKTEILDQELDSDLEDLIPEEIVVIIITLDGYIKKQSIKDYKAQKRGGKGKKSIKLDGTDEESVVIEIFVSNSHSFILFFSSFGKVYKIKAYKLPEASSNSKGRAMVNLFPLEKDEVITNIMPLPRNEKEWNNLNILFATANGLIRRSDMQDFVRINAGGKIAIKLHEGDSLIGVSLCSDEDHVMLATANGKSIKFSLAKIRIIKSRNSSGIRGIKLAGDDKVISLTVINGLKAELEERMNYLKLGNKERLELKYKLEEELEKGEDAALVNLSEEDKKIIAITELPLNKFMYLLKRENFIISITENGYGKRTSSIAYNQINRGGSGVINIITDERNGKVVACFPVKDLDDIMLVTNKGKMIRSPVKDIAISGRNTKGVIILKVGESEKVVSVALISSDIEDTKDNNNDSENKEENIDIDKEEN